MHRYTGEDGFELSVPDEKALELTRELLKSEVLADHLPYVQIMKTSIFRKFLCANMRVKIVLCTLQEVRMCGLGARDSLRLEAGLCLYGKQQFVLDLLLTSPLADVGGGTTGRPRAAAASAALCIDGAWC